MAKAESAEYRCEECDEEFSSESEMREHNDTFHKGQQGQKSEPPRRKTA